MSLKVEEGYKTIRYEVEECRARITFNRPGRHIAIS